MVGNKKLRVLISDDEPHIRMMLKGIVNTMNAEVIGEAKNGEETLDIFRHEHPHMTLLDINMPIKNGVDTLKEIKGEYPEAFIIMMTSMADMETVQTCIDHGADSYILKNTPIMEIKQMIKDAWDDHKGNLRGENGKTV